MRLSRLWIRDLTASFLVSLAAIYYGLFEAGIRVPDLGSVRAVSAVVLFLGIAACAVGADPGVFKPRPAVGLLIQIQKVLGYAALGIGLVAIALGSEPLLTALFVVLAVLWTSATLRHLTRRPIPSRRSSRARPATGARGAHI